MLSKKFGECVPDRLPFFFTDSYDLAEDYDETKKAARGIIRLAQNNPEHFETRFLRKCLDVNWRDWKDKIETLQLEMWSSLEI